MTSNLPTRLQSRASELTTLAHRLLIAELEQHGNQISQNHDFALWQLVSRFTEQGLHIRSGRFAYSLACGAGKTLSVVAWIAAQHQLGLGLSVAISAQQIESLCDIKSSLIKAGVPEALIGIRHTKGNAVAWPDTGEAHNRPIMLGSHARIQGKDELPAFCMYNGIARDLLFWDESLISSDATTLQLRMMETSLSHFADQDHPLLSTVLLRLKTELLKEHVNQRGEGTASCMALLTTEESDAALQELGTPYCATIGEAGLLKTARQALSMLKHSVSLLDVGAGASGKGLMRYRIMVSPELENIAVLDASFAVRELCKADPTIINGTTEVMQYFKSYANVCVKQTLVASGRSQFWSQGGESNAALIAAIESIRCIPADKSILVFIFKEQNKNILRWLMSGLSKVGIDPEETLSCGKKRISFNTWGQHTTDNTFAACEHVVLLGVLRMPRLVLAASMAGQKDDLLYRMSNENLMGAELSELASNVMQAMNRGSCRKIADGKALPMTVHLLTKEKGLQTLLQKAMSELKWENIHIEAIQTPTKTKEATDKIVAYVLSLAADQLKVSKKAIFSACRIDLASAAKAQAMSDAMTILREHAWKLLVFPWTEDKLSLVRKPNVENNLGNLPWLKKALLISNYNVGATEAI